MLGFRVLVGEDATRACHKILGELHFGPVKYCYYPTLACKERFNRFRPQAVQSLDAFPNSMGVHCLD